MGGRSRPFRSPAVQERTGGSRLLAPRADPQRAGQGVPGRRPVRGRRSQGADPITRARAPGAVSRSPRNAVNTAVPSSFTRSRPTKRHRSWLAIPAARLQPRTSALSCAVARTGVSARWQHQRWARSSSSVASHRATATCTSRSMRSSKKQVCRAGGPVDRRIDDGAGLENGDEGVGCDSLLGTHLCLREQGRWPESVPPR